MTHKRCWEVGWLIGDLRRHGGYAIDNKQSMEAILPGGLRFILSILWTRDYSGLVMSPSEFR